MAKTLDGLTNGIDPYEIARFSVRMTYKKTGRPVTREEVLRMQKTAGREWTEEEIQGILAAGSEN